MCYTIRYMKKVTELRVKGISLDRLANKPRLLLQDVEGDVTVSLTINPYEANALIMEMENLAPAGTSTYDSIINLFNKHGFAANSVLLHSFIQEACLADLHYRKGLRAYSPARTALRRDSLGRALESPDFSTRRGKTKHKTKLGFSLRFGRKKPRISFSRSAKATVSIFIKPLGLELTILFAS